MKENVQHIYPVSQLRGPYCLVSLSSTDREVLPVWPWSNPIFRVNVNPEVLGSSCRDRRGFLFLVIHVFPSRATAHGQVTGLFSSALKYLIKNNSLLHFSLLWVTITTVDQNSTHWTMVVNGTVIYDTLYPLSYGFVIHDTLFITWLIHFTWTSDLSSVTAMFLYQTRILLGQQVTPHV